MSDFRRIIWHWTAGAKGLNPVEADSYHWIVQPDGSLAPGAHPVTANLPPLRPGAYAAHTLNCNSRSIGISLDAMAGAVERPFVPGPNPITWDAVRGLIRITAEMCRTHGIAVARDTTLSHAEVQPTLGIAQHNKWDITWLPDMARPGDPVVVGDRLRAMLRDALT